MDIQNWKNYLVTWLAALQRKAYLFFFFKCIFSWGQKAARFFKRVHFKSSLFRFAFSHWSLLHIWVCRCLSSSIVSISFCNCYECFTCLKIFRPFIFSFFFFFPITMSRRRIKYILFGLWQFFNCKLISSIWSVIFHLAGNNFGSICCFSYR